MTMILSGNGTMTGLVSGGLPDGTVLPADLSTGGPSWDTSGNLLVGVTSATANGGDVQVSKGITFPATQVACSDANTLDDYEEGTFTPTVYGGTTAGTTTYNTSNTYGRYVKIGQWVFIELSVVWSSSTGATGVFLVGGLPFTCSNFSNHFPTASIGYYAYGTSPGWQNLFQSGLVSPNTTLINIYYSGSTTMSPVGAAVLNSGGGNIYISTMYLAA